MWLKKKIRCRMSIIWDFGHRELTGSNFLGGHPMKENKSILVAVSCSLYPLVVSVCSDQFGRGDGGQVTTIASHN